MSVILKVDVGEVIDSHSGVLINTLETRKLYKHHNIVVTKNEDTYTITAEESKYDLFLENQYEPSVVDQFVDKDVSVTKSWLFGLFKGGTRYVYGLCEKKERQKVTYTTNNLVIKQ